MLRKKTSLKERDTQHRITRAENKSQGFKDGLADYTAGVDEYLASERMLETGQPGYAAGYFHGYKGQTTQENDLALWEDYMGQEC